MILRPNPALDPSTMLNIKDTLPAGFFAAGPKDLNKLLGASFSFENGAADIRFVDHLDHYNFNELPAGTILARMHQVKCPIIEVLNEQGRNVTGDYFQIEDGLLKTRAHVMSSMLTRVEAIIRNDCLCYVMESFPFALAHSDS